MSEKIAAECPSCGKVFAVAASFAGKKIRCPQCQGVIQISGGSPAAPGPRSSGAPSSTRAAEPAPQRSEPRVARPVKQDEPAVARPSKPASARAAAARPEPKPTRSAPSKRKKSDNYDAEQPWDDLDSYDDQEVDAYSNNAYGGSGGLPPRSKKAGTTKKTGAVTEPASSSGGRTDGGVIVGILMMVGAVVWFFGGLAFDVLFYYPPILFILGLVTTIKGALNIGK